MRVLSLLQPWASLVAWGHKKYECRSWRTDYRGPLLIHASARKPNKREKLMFEQADIFSIYISDMNMLPYGCLIAKVVLKEIYSTDFLIQHLELDPFHNWTQELAFDDYSPGRYAWILQSAEAFSNHIPVKGSLGLWEYNGHL
jgi:hypothetical protein